MTLNTPLNSPLNSPEWSYGRAGDGSARWPAGAPPAPARAARRGLVSVRAGLAELVLLNRLRARTREDAELQTLERAAQILEVTSRHWFGEGDRPPAP